MTVKLRLLVGLAASVSIAGCGDTTTIVKTVTTSSAPAVASTTQAPDPPKEPVAEPEGADAAPADDDARLGDKLSLDTSETTLDVIARAVIDPLPVGEFDEPGSGMRFVGVRLAVSNTGDATYDLAVSNGSTLVLADDEQADPTLVSDGPCSSGFSSSVKIAAGDQRVGCIAFEVPVGKRLRGFQFTPNSGFADETAEWRLPSRAAGKPSSRPVPEPEAEQEAEQEPPVVPSRAGNFTACDANISAETGTTTCPFAENAFYEYFVSGEASSISVFSPATGMTYSAECSGDGTRVTCSTEDGGAVRFSQSAIDAYSDDQAADYAAGHRLGP